MTTRREFLGYAGAAAVAGAADFGFGRAWAQSSDKVVMGYLPANAETVIYIKTRDFFRESGVNMELLRATGGPAILQAMASGDVPAGDIGTAPAVIAAARGLPFYYLTLGCIGTPERTYTRIMVKGDSPIKSVEQLKGKKLALHQRGTMEDLCLSALGKTFHVTKNDLEIVPVPFPNQPQAIAQGLVDAAYAGPPFDTVAERQFGCRALVATSEFVPWLGYGTLAVRRDFADSKPDQVKALVRGWILTSRWIRENERRATEDSNSFLGIAPELGQHMTQPYWTRNPLPVMANAWHIYELLVADNVIKPVEDATKMMHDYFVAPTEKFAVPVLEQLGYQDDPVQSAMIKGKYPMLPKPNAEYLASWEKAIIKA